MICGHTHALFDPPSHRTVLQKHSKVCDYELRIHAHANYPYSPAAFS